MAGEQTYSTHRRYYPWYHFVVVPILTANLIVEIVRLVKAPNPYGGWLVAVALGLLVFSYTSRAMSLRAQDRVIRLEERLRLLTILPQSDRGLIDQLQPRHFIALRFAPDEEVPDLVRRCASGELRSGNEIKKAIRNWKPDYLRV